MSRLQKLLSRIGLPDPRLGARAQAHLDQLTKPPGSLGRLEELARRVVEITGKDPPSVKRPLIFTLAGDHGVVVEGVSAYPQVVTAQMVENFLRGGAAVNVLARHAGARVLVADLGVATPLPSHPALVVKKVAPGTANLARGPAMTRSQAIQAIESGIQLVDAEARTGCDLIGLGEMGIGNTTAASAITSVLTGVAPEAVTGRGTGIDEATWQRKVAVIRRALAVNQPDPTDGLDVLAKVGGFEIGGLVGVILSAAAARIPVVVDGFIAGAAALIAVTLKPEARPFLLASHCSAEPGHRVILGHLGLKPYLDLELRLGEGTGAALAFTLIQAAVKVYTEMATFKSAGVSTSRGD
ncbi:MAG: nicotinate-nucleotide--dimethylbenzimidazole phosphoribosyltransferase [Candidatus Rokubacteria bacterium]|nr:nicotinate-nucleotide--dimethylbenzimidazole phosphoribosyltransferase [Candidatus Rokubacteria bacterium]